MDRKKLCLPFLNLVVSRAEANKQLCNSISLLDKYLEGANLINCTNLILNCFYFPLFLRFHRWDFEHQFMLGKGKEKTSLTHDKTPEHHCLPWLMGYVFLSWPANSGCLFIIWHFFFSESRGVSVFLEPSWGSFVWELICYLENSLHQCPFPSPKPRTCGPLSLWCIHSISIQIINSLNKFRLKSLIPVCGGEIFTGSLTLVSWGIERGSLTAVLPHPTCGAVCCKPFYQRAMGSSLWGRIGNQLMDRKYLLWHINSLPCQPASL